MTHAEYLAYLQSPTWKRKRAQVLRRDDRRCVLCHSTERLEVHHASYERRGHEALTDLVTLCHECHTTISRPRWVVRLVQIFGRLLP